MYRIAAIIAHLSLMGVATPALADTATGWRSGETELPASFECVEYAREASGIRLYGDAREWWDQADGRYARGASPKAGAIMTLKPSGPMQLGHVAKVSRVVDARTILLDHANWSPINGVRGQVERNVQAVDVSPRNDWSEVRIWYAPANDLGTTRWPVQGFIYPQKSSAPAKVETRVAAVPVASRQVAMREGQEDLIGEIIAGS